jgi:hypothetical protein
VDLSRTAPHTRAVGRFDGRWSRPEEERRMTPIPLPPHATAPKVVIACVAALALTVTAMGAGVRLAGVAQRDADPLVVVGVVGVLVGVFLAVRRLVAGPTLTLRVEGRQVHLAAGARDVASAPLDEARVRFGYYAMSGRYGTFHYPAIALELPGARPLCVGVQDLTATYYWAGDDPWQHRQAQGDRLPTATHLASGEAFVDLARAVGLRDALVVRGHGV